MTGDVDITWVWKLKGPVETGSGPSGTSSKAIEEADERLSDRSLSGVEVKGRRSSRSSSAEVSSGSAAAMVGGDAPGACSSGLSDSDSMAAAERLH